MLKPNLLFHSHALYPEKFSKSITPPTSSSIFGHFLVRWLVSFQNTGPKVITSIEIIILLWSLQVATVAGFPYGLNITSIIRYVWSLFPPNLFAVAVNSLAEATATPEDVGISWSRRTECVPNASATDECVISVVRKILCFSVKTHYLNSNFAAEC